MVVQFIQHRLLEKSTHHRAALTRLEIGAQSEPLSDKVVVMNQTSQMQGMNTIIHTSTLRARISSFTLTASQPS